MFPEIDLIDAFLELYNRMMLIKGREGECEGNNKESKYLNDNDKLSPPNLDDSD